MSTYIDPVAGDDPAAILIAVPEDALAELAESDLVGVIPTLRGPVLDAVVTVGVDAASLVTLAQAPGQVRVFAAWLTAWARRRKETITIIGTRGGRSVHIKVDGDVPVDAIADFLLAAFREARDESPPDQNA
jgi:hypothetical protein